MKELNCEVIRDLLPSYFDKITSEETNEIVMKHLKGCKECSEILNNMNKDIGENNFNQNEQIDFLNGFRKDKKNAIIKTILIVIIIMLTIFLFMQEVVTKIKFPIDISETNLCLWSESKLDEENTELLYMASNEKCDLEFKNISFNDKEVHIKAIGRYSFGKTTRNGFYVTINANTEKIIFEDGHGNTKEIWNKERGNLVDTANIQKN